MTLLVEHLALLPQLRRLTGHDCFIPLGPAAASVLPNVARIVAMQVDLLQD